MKCPLFTLASAYTYPSSGIMWTDCLKEECAWWLPVDKSCALVAIHYRLANLVEFLDIIKDKMPPGQSFVK